MHQTGPRWAAAAILLSLILPLAGQWAAPAVARTPPGPVLRSGPWPMAGTEPQPAQAGPRVAVESPPRVRASAALLMDWETGQVLWHKHGFTRRAPASTTKVMTAILAIEQGRMDDRVTVSQRAARTRGSSMHLRAGDVWTLKDLLHGLLLNSGNDAAVAIAEHLAGSVGQFAQAMNEKAAAIGAKNTRFVNPHGLHHPGHFSTAYDLALMTRYAIRLPLFAAIVRQKEAEVQLGENVRALRNTNRLLWMYEGADGVKTGTTSAAGACLVSSATRGDRLRYRDHKLVAVVLDADSRWQDSVRLLEWGFTQFQLAELAEPGEVLGFLPVAGGREPWVGLAPAEGLSAVIPRQAGGRLPTIELEVPPEVAAPLHPGQPLGSARVIWDGKTQMVVPLVAAERVGPATWATRVSRPLAGWFRRLGRWGLLH